MSAHPDVIDSALAIAPTSPLAQLRLERAKVTAATQRSYDNLVGPGFQNGLTLAERLPVAFDISLTRPMPLRCERWATPVFRRKTS